jgi:RNA polymerase sigma-70 factor (ECF subfamily)
MKGTLDYALLVKRFERAVRHKVFALVRNAADADEVTECVFERVYPRLDRFDSTKGSLCTWLFTIAHNVAVSFLRQRNRRLESLDAMEEDEGPTCAGPEESHDARERRTRLRRCIADMDPRERHAFVGRHLRHLPWRQLAAEMHCCIRSAHNWLARAVEKLQKEW